MMRAAFHDEQPSPQESEPARGIACTVICKQAFRWCLAKWCCVEMMKVGGGKSVWRTVRRTLVPVDGAAAEKAIFGLFRENLKGAAALLMCETRFCPVIGLRHVRECRCQYLIQPYPGYFLTAGTFNTFIYDGFDYSIPKTFAPRSYRLCHQTVLLPLSYVTLALIFFDLTWLLLRNVPNRRWR